MVVYLCSFAAAAAAKLLQSCPTLCDRIEGNPQGSAVPGILQVRTLEWVAISFSIMLLCKLLNANKRKKMFKIVTTYMLYLIWGNCFF